MNNTHGSDGEDLGPAHAALEENELREEHAEKVNGKCNRKTDTPRKIALHPFPSEPRVNDSNPST